jgi:hypothetical protein
MSKVTKTEHAGAKNGGGYWGKRAEAKEVSNSKRRRIDKQHAQARADESDNDAKTLEGVM